MIQPTIGRVVWFKDPGLSDQFCSASVVYVHKDGRINLAGFDLNGQAFNRHEVVLFQGKSEDCPDHQACWMPYQQAQATQASAKPGPTPTSTVEAVKAAQEKAAAAHAEELKKSGVVPEDKSKT